jgi:hypothetical protein
VRNEFVVTHSLTDDLAQALELVFNQVAATLTELELVDLRDYAHENLFPIHNTALFPCTSQSTWACTFGLLPNLRRLRLINYLPYEEQVVAFFDYLSSSKLARIPSP